MPLFRRIFKVATYVQAISNYLADFARQMGYKGAISVVPNGVDVKHFSAFEQTRVDAIKQMYKKQKGDFWLITASRLVEKNANDVVIRSLAKLPANVRFIIAGLGPDRTKLEELATELGVAERVIFLGHVEHTELPNYFRAADAFIRPSRTEGFGNAFVEAMAAELPVIATTAGGIADFLKHDENGLEVGIDSVDDIVTQTLRLMHDDALRQRLVVNASVMVCARYEWEMITKQMSDIFNGIN